jgi:hypothetical protein
MKFDYMINKILLAEGANLATGRPEGVKPYEYYPEEALRKLSEAYAFLTTHKASPEETRKAMNYLNIVRYIIQKANNDTFTVGDEELSKRDLIKDAILGASRFGNKEGGKNGKFAVPPVERLDAPQHDIDGNVIPASTATDRSDRLSGTDYRLSIFLKSQDVRKYGGDSAMHEIYKVLFPYVGLKYQVTTRREEEAPEGDRIVEVYWWGENFLPYRTVLKINAQGLLAKHKKIIKDPYRDEDAGAVLWRTDHLFGMIKARPLSLLGPEGSYEGNIIKNKTGEEILQILRRQNFDKITAEIRKNLTLSDEEKQQLFQKQQAYEQRNDKVEIYKAMMADYETKRIATSRGSAMNYNMPQEFKDVYEPFFTLFRETNGRIMPIGATAKQKFEQLFPREEFGELYGKR